MSRDRAGFTIVELIVVTMLGLLLLLAIYQVLITNQRTYRENAENVQEQQAARMALEVLVSELQELSAEGGDLTAIASDSVAFQAMHRFGLVCEVTYAPLAITVDLVVQKYDTVFSTSDSVVVFADNDTDQTDDDAWIKVIPNSIDTDEDCPDGSAGQELTFTAQALAFISDSVRTGGPIRSLVRKSYGLGTYGGQTFLMRTMGGSTTPIAGPLEDTAGVTFEYYDGAEVATTNPADVQKIVVTVNSGTTLSATVFPRN